MQTLVLDVSGNQKPEIALLRRFKSTGFQDIMLRNIRNRFPRERGRYIGFDQSLKPIALHSIRDINGNRADEVVLLGLL
jgi:hypothetical protein